MFGICLSWFGASRGCCLRRAACGGAAACGTQHPACPQPTGNVIFCSGLAKGSGCPGTRQRVNAAGTELARKPFPWVCFVGRLYTGFDAIARIHSDVTMFSALNHRFP